MASRSVLVAHHDPEALERLTFDLADRGYEVVGRARTAGLALALAAQTPVSHAVISERLAGRRKGSDLAKALREIWGVRSFILRESRPAT